MADMHTPLRIAEVMKEEAANGAACGWQSCTGCHETNEGAETGHYPYSKMFGCYVGSGCSECGGLGVVWLYYSRADLDDMASETAAPAPSQDAETVKALREQIATKDAALAPFAKCSEVYPDALPEAAAAFGSIYDPRCPLTVGDFHVARAALAGSAS